MTLGRPDELESTVSSLVADHLSPLSGAELSVDRALWERLDELGFVTVALPERLGGSGGNMCDASTVVRACALAAVPIMQAAFLAAHLLAAADITWPGGVVTATEATEVGIAADGTHLRIRGRIGRVPWLRHADHLVMLIHERGRPLVAVVPTSDHVVLRHGRNLAGEPRDDALLTDVAARAWSPVAATYSDSLAAHGAVGAASQIAGAAEQAVRSATRHVHEREQFGKPLVAFQAVQHQLAQMAADAAMLRVCSTAAAAALDDRSRDALLMAASAKVESSLIARRITSASHQLHGAIGFTREHHLAAATTRMWSWREEYGSELHWQRKIAELATDAEYDVWALLTGT